MAARNTTATAPAELELSLEALEIDGATNGGRVKYSGRVEVDGGTALVIVYLPAESARKDVAVGVIGSGAKLKAEAPKATAAAPKANPALAAARRKR